MHGSCSMLCKVGPWPGSHRHLGSELLIIVRDPLLGDARLLLFPFYAKTPASSSSERPLLQFFHRLAVFRVVRHLEQRPSLATCHSKS